MSIKFNKISVTNIEGGDCVKVIDEYLDMTTKDLFKMAKLHHIKPEKLKGHVIIKLTISPINSLEDHYRINSEIHRVVPKISNSTMAVVEEDGLFVQERGSDKDSPRQTTIDNFIEEVEKDGEFIKVLGTGEKIDTRSGEIIKDEKKA